MLGWRETAICRATPDGAVWIGHVKRPGGIKLPATLAFPETTDLPELPLAGCWKAAEPTWQDIAYEEAAGVGFLSFEFYNGAMSTAQCRRLTEAFRWATTRPTKVIVLRGGSDFWSNGIHLNTIGAAERPADGAGASGWVVTAGVALLWFRTEVAGVARASNCHASLGAKSACTDALLLR